MKHHLNIQPFDFDYDFLHDIRWNSKSLYKIERVSVLPRKTLPPCLLLSPKSLLAKLFMRKGKMVYLDDLLKELEKYVTNDPKIVFLVILPHYVLGFGESLVGLTPKPNLSIVSTYGMRARI